MSNRIALDDWIDAIDREYLFDFIGAGGAAVKFAVANENRRPALRQALQSLSESQGYLFVGLDAATCRVHMPQDLFFGMARQIDWRVLARRAVLSFLAEEGFRVEGIDVRETRAIDAVIDENRSGRDYIGGVLRPYLEDRIFRNADLSKAFRIAMLHLCRHGRVSGATSSGLADGRRQQNRPVARLPDPHPDRPDDSPVFPGIHLPLDTASRLSRHCRPSG